MNRPASNLPSSAIEALGTAWTVYSLYPDPEHQPAFRRAIEALREVASQPLAFEIDVAGFRHEGEPVLTDREGADRLAKRCYLHNVEALAINQPPSEGDVARLFSALAKEENTTQASGGVEGALRRDGVTCFAVAQRALLRTAAKEDLVDRNPAVQEVLDRAIDPAAFAEALMAEADGDPERLATLFYSKYHEVLGEVTTSDVTGREGVVQAFVEAFFYVDERGQLEVFTTFLGEADPDNRTFIDQFAGHELAQLAPRLDSQGLALLLDYARVATDHADHRPAELLGILRNPEALQSMREVAAAKVQERLSDLTEAAQHGEQFLLRVKDQFPDPARYFYDSLEVFRGLLAVEQRDDRFARLMRIWVGKVADSVRRRQFRRAELWLRAGTSKPTYPSDRAGEVEDALSQIAARDVLSIVVEAATDSEDVSEPSARLMKALGPRAVNVLIDLLAEEEHRGRRRTLIDLLTQVAAANPAPLVARLNDDRWYLVRNILTVLRQTGTVTSASAIVQAAAHDDPRVRIEALRALAATGDTGVAYLERAFSDSNEKVRQTAVGLLGAHRTAVGEAALIKGLENRRLGTEDKSRIVSALSSYDSAASRQILAGLASKRFAWSASTRALRAAAKAAMREGAS